MAARDTYTFLINYLLLIQLRHTAQLLLLPVSTARILRTCLPTSSLVRTTSATRFATATEIAVVVLIEVDATTGTRLRFLEVGECGEDCRTGVVRILPAVLETTFRVVPDATVGAARASLCWLLLVGQHFGLGLGDVLVDLLQL